MTGGGRVHPGPLPMWALRSGTDLSTPLQLLVLPLPKSRAAALDG